MGLLGSIMYTIDICTYVSIYKLKIHERNTVFLLLFFSPYKVRIITGG
jgi:hypothetical protein